MNGLCDNVGLFISEWLKMTNYLYNYFLILNESFVCLKTYHALHYIMKVYMKILLVLTCTYSSLYIVTIS